MFSSNALKIIRLTKIFNLLEFGYIINKNHKNNKQQQLLISSLIVQSIFEMESIYHTVEIEATNK
jgi:hypothetical protein